MRDHPMFSTCTTSRAAFSCCATIFSVLADSSFLSFSVPSENSRNALRFFSSSREKLSSTERSRAASKAACSSRRLGENIQHQYISLCTVVQFHQHVFFLDIHLNSSRQFRRTRKQSARRCFLELTSDYQSLHEWKVSQQARGSFTWSIKTSAPISLSALPLFAFLN